MVKRRRKAKRKAKRRTTKRKTGTAVVVHRKPVDRVEIPRFTPGTAVAGRRGLVVDDRGRVFCFDFSHSQELSLTLVKPISRIAGTTASLTGEDK
jgi:hypothetical protein